MDLSEILFLLKSEIRYLFLNSSLDCHFIELKESNAVRANAISELTELFVLINDQSLFTNCAFVILFMKINISVYLLILWGSVSVRA